MGNDYNWDRNEYWLIPTEEDVLDVNFRAIVSDCRGIISGNLVPRPWADISGTWNQSEPQRKKNTGKYKIREVGGIAPSKLAPSLHKPVPRKRVPREISAGDRSYNRNTRRLMRILVANGMEPLAAFTKASQLLRENANAQK